CREDETISCAAAKTLQDAVARAGADRREAPMSDDIAAPSPVPAAGEAYARAVRAVLAHRPEAGPALGDALAADPGFVAAHALKGLAGVLLGRSETVAAARLCLGQAHHAATLRPLRPGEAAMLEALAEATEGRLLAAAGIVEDDLRRRPHDILALK